MASWTTTIVIVSTSAARLTIDAATVDRIAAAASGSPTTLGGIALKSKRRSREIVANESSAPASTHITGTNHRLDPMWMSSFERFMPLSDSPWRSATHARRAYPRQCAPKPHPG
jgi:hypothetical protein